jgi:hypothetical protein
MATITAASDETVLSPVMVLDYAYDRASRNVVLDTLGTPYPTVFLREALSRAGTLSLLFDSGTAARDAVNVLSRPDRYTFSEPGVGEQWDFVVTGNVSNKKVAGHRFWIVDAVVREVEVLP